MKAMLMWGLRFFVVVGFMGAFSAGLANASSFAPPSPQEKTLEGAIEWFGQAPWIFLGQVQSVEIVTDAASPLSIFPRWQAQYTRFRVIRGIKGPFHEGYEVELKECAPRPHPSQSLCGTLYSQPVDSKIGEIFLVITGPGNPNVYKYQTSIRLPATRVPVLIKPTPSPDKPSLEETMEEGFSRTWSESGWMIDLTGFMPNRAEKKMTKEEEGSAESSSPFGAKGKASGFSDQKGPQPLDRSGIMDLNQLTRELGKIGK